MKYPLPTNMQRSTTAPGALASFKPISLRPIPSFTPFTPFTPVTTISSTPTSPTPTSSTPIFSTPTFSTPTSPFPVPSTPTSATSTASTTSRASSAFSLCTTSTHTSTTSTLSLSPPPPPSPSTYSYPPAHRLIKVQVMQHRHPSLTPEQFHRYWSTHHGPLVSKMLARHAVVGYTQTHIPQPLSSTTTSPPTPTSPTTLHPPPELQFPTPQQTRSLSSLSRFAATLSNARGFAVKTYDALVEFTVRDLETLERVFTDPAYLECVRPDEGGLFDKGGGDVIVGWVEEFVSRGVVVEGMV